MAAAGSTAGSATGPAQPSERSDASAAADHVPASALESAFGTVCVLAMTLGPIYTLRSHIGDFPAPWEDDTFVQVVFGALHLLAAIALALTWRRCRRPSPAVAPLVAIAAMAIASTAWSVAPDQTLDRSLLFAGTAVTGAWIGLRFSTGEQVRLVAWAMLAGSAVSCMVALGWPGSGTMTDRPGVFWSGIYFNRNSLAPVAALGAITAVVMAFGATRGAPRVAWLAATVLHLVVLQRTSARTAVAVVGACAAVGSGVALLRVARRRGLRPGSAAVIATASAVSVVLAAWALFDRAVAWAGVDPTLDNRTPLWSFVEMEIGLRRIRGYGFYAYWVGPTTSIRAIGYLNWSPPTAHNGFLEIGLGLGWIGLALMLLVTLWTVVSAATTAWRGIDAWTVWPILMTTFFITTDLTESFTLPNQFIWLLFVAVAVGTTSRRHRTEIRST